MQGKAKLYAVIDTNVIVSSFFSLDGTSNPAIVIGAVLSGAITPLYNDEILREYIDVLARPKFPFSKSQIEEVIAFFKDFGLDTKRTKATDEAFSDSDDIVFYEVMMTIGDAFLVTGNIKQFPDQPFVVTPAEMVEILKKKGLL